MKLTYCRKSNASSNDKDSFHCRVPPNDSIDRLRDHIEEQLGFDIVPEDFVYLRSVGRCMAVVRFNLSLFYVHQISIFYIIKFILIYHPIFEIVDLPVLCKS